jgi:small subunit ribosomal protein S7
MTTRRVLAQNLSKTSRVSEIPRLGSHRDPTYNIQINNVFNEAIANIKPFFEVRKVRVAGSTYQVPAVLSRKRQEYKAINWLLESTHERKKKNSSQSFEYCLAYEIYEAFLKQGSARQKRNELHKLAESNRAFSHFRWW